MKALKDIVNEYLFAQGKDASHDFQRILQCAIRGLKDLHYDVSGEPVEQYVALEDNNTIAIPDDIVTIIGIFYPSEDNELVPIVENKSLAPKRDNCGSLTNPEERVFDFINYTTQPYNFYAQHFRNGEVIGGFFRERGGTNLFYNINQQNGTIEFSDTVSGTVLLTYLGTPKRISGNFLVHQFLEEPLLTWIHWDSIRYRNNMPLQEKQYRKQEYYDMKHLAERRIDAIRLGDAIDSARHGKTWAPKL